MSRSPSCGFTTIISSINCRSYWKLFFMGWGGLAPRTKKTENLLISKIISLFNFIKILILKRQCHKIVDTFFYQKTPPGLIWTGKNNVTKIFSTNLCLHSRWLCWHGVSVVVDYANTMSAWPLTMLTLFPRSQRLCGHGVSVVLDYAGTVSA